MRICRPWCIAVLMFVCLVVASATARAQSANDPATLAQSQGKVSLNGAPFFPLIATHSGCLNEKMVSAEIAMGANVIQDRGAICGDVPLGVQNLHALLNGRVWWKEDDPNLQAQMSDLPELVDWQTNLKIVFDTPFLNTCYPTPHPSTTAVFDQVKAAAKYDSVAYFIELAAYPILPNSRPSCLDGKSVAAEFWTAVLAGAKAITYSTVDSGNKSDFDVKADVVAQTTKQNQQVKSLMKVLVTGTKNALKVHLGGAVRAGSWKIGAKTYVIAVNTANVPTVAEITIPGMKAKTVGVLWEARHSLKTTPALIRDRFNALGVHAYVIPK
jgi:hypothetical protein